MNFLQLRRAVMAVLFVLLPGVAGVMKAMGQDSVLTGALSGVFSVSEDETVYFSQGNLQYQASTNIWRFAGNQWDYIGSDNANISESYDGWIDFFGWGTSGYNHGANCYQPWSTSGDYEDYLAYGGNNYNLFDQSGLADWGCNVISNGGNQENSGWRTLTKPEWDYVFNSRVTSSGIRYAKANVNEVKGVILLPDDWQDSFFTLNNTNTTGANYSVNTIDLDQWTVLEQHGAVFLPAGGYRFGTSVSSVGSYGYYWSASYSNSYSAYSVYYSGSGLNAHSTYSRNFGQCVRLVVPVPPVTYGINATPNPAEGGTITGIGTYNEGTECTLTAEAFEGFTFVNWTENGGVVSTDPTYLFTVTGDRELVANFELTDPIIIDYVSDGLIMYLDGIRNKRIGHSSNTDVWEDLVGNYDVAVTNYDAYTWANNHFMGLGNGGYLNTDKTWQYFYSLNDDITIEIVTYIDCDRTSPAYRGLVGWHVDADGANVQNDQGSNRMQTLGSLPVTVADDQIATVSYTKNNGSFLDGVWRTETNNLLNGVNSSRLVVFGNSFSSQRGWNDSIYCIRMYNRTLTSDEIAYNHSVDVERFGASSLNLFNIAASPNPAEGGTVSGTGVYVEGDGCRLTAIAADGYGFVNWTENGEVVSTNSTYLFTVTGDRELVANFASEFTITALANPVEYGTVTGDGVYDYGATCTLEASANEGCTFINWTEDGNVVSWSTTYSFGVNRDRDLRANFISVSFPLIEPFEEYAVGNTISTEAISIGHDWWTTWNNLPGGSAEGVVVEFGDSHCGHFTYGSDQVLLLGNQESGFYNISFDMYIPEGKDAYNNMLHVFASTGSEWATEVYYKHSSKGTSIQAAGIITDFDCLYDTWFNVMYIVDIERDMVTFYVDNVEIVTWQFSLRSNGNAGTKRLAAINFYAPTSTEVSEFYIDNIAVTTVVPTYHVNTSANIVEGGSATGFGEFNYGEECTLTAIPAEGYSFVNWTENGESVSTEAVYAFTVTSERDLVANYLPLPNYTNGTLTGLFSVGEGSMVRFSQGNLQYQSSSNTWRFADFQFSTIDEENANISETYNGWIDLFGWGTSGYNHGANCYQPWSTSTDVSDYYAYGCDTCNLFDQNGMADWGYNAIGNGGTIENLWKTLTYEEWVYVLNTRNTNSGIRYAKAQVCGRGGLILLPDNWDASYYELNNTNQADVDYSSNVICALDWETMLESKGAVFLPVAGYRENTSVKRTGLRGYYWSSSFQEGNAGEMVVREDDILINFEQPYYGQSVRLVRPVENYSFSINATPNPAEGGMVSGAGVYEAGSECTLTAEAFEGYTFVNWTENGEVVSTDPTYLFTVTGNRDLVANFMEESPLFYENLVAYYPFDGDVNDYSGNGNHGTINGNVVPALDRHGNVNGAYRFPGQAFNYISVPDAEVLHISSFTLSAWVFTDADSYGSGFVINKGRDINNGAYSLRTHGVFAQNDYSGQNVAYYEPELEMNQWHMITGTVEGNLARFYVDGMLKVEATLTHPFSYGNSEPLVIGMHYYSGVPSYWTYPFLGVIDEVRIYNRPLSSEEVMQLYHYNEGALSGLFSVSENTAVNFSQGNLQYKASSNTWRFAENQWDCVGSDNTNISESYNGWIDLFGWGTSGYNHGANCYQPWSTSTNSSDYYAYGSDGYNLDDQDGQADWGYNAISNGGNQENSGWRTPTQPEWDYLFNTRSTASGVRYAKACVNGVNGVILLPDDWQTSYFALNNTNTSYTSYSTNAISAEQWATLERHGAAFLPAAGYRNGTSVYYVGSNGGYWSASNNAGNIAWIVSFDNSGLYTVSSINPYSGFSVRLVRPVQTVSYSINATSNSGGGGTVHGAGAYFGGTTCVLTATPNEGWTFVNWTENGVVVSTDPEYHFIVTREKTLVANFTRPQYTTMETGWTWYSTFVELSDINGLATLEEGLGDNGVMIKSQKDGFLMYDFGEWMGALSAMNNESMYLINVNAPCSVVFNGRVADLAQHPITLAHGWTWIGYPSAVATDIYTALSNLTPQDGDVIKTQDAFSQYSDDLGWTGGLNTLEPGAGLMYHSLKSQSVSFVYAEGAKNGELKKNITPEGNHFVLELNTYPFNMSVMAVVELDDQELRGGHYELAAFAGDECRGSAQLQYVEALDRYIAFLTVTGNEATTLGWRLYDDLTGQTYLNDEEVTFEADAIMGSIKHPVTLRFNSGTTLTNDWLSHAKIWPNPVKANETLQINLSANTCEAARIEVVDALGVVVDAVKMNGESVTLKAPKVPGLYLVRVTTDNGLRHGYKLIVK